jgi:hypothetical protein
VEARFSTLAKAPVTERDERLLCAVDSKYFISQYCWIEDTANHSWVRFQLWESQKTTLEKVEINNLVVILKARQLGLTWLLICYALWVMLFRKGSGVLLFSRRDDEASELLERMKKVHRRLPPFLQSLITADNDHEFVFGNLDSWARSFPTTKHSGRMYTASLAIVDEADFIVWLKRLLNAVKPTIDAGGQMVLLSTVDKENYGSEFKRIWNQAVSKTNSYLPIFLPWNARPDRNQAWYRRQAGDYEQDDLFQEYPAHPEEALAARQASKRFSPLWLTRCRGRKTGFSDQMTIPGFTCFVASSKFRAYLVSADPAEGNPASDPSAAMVFDRNTWEQVAVLHGRFEPDIFASYLIRIAETYNQACICWERNNHGHAVEVALRHRQYQNLYISPFDRSPGWLSTVKTKVLAVDNAAQVLRDGDCRINDEATLGELAIFEAATLKAPEGETDDLAMALVIGLAALRWPSLDEGKGEGRSEMIPPRDFIAELRF